VLPFHLLEMYSRLFSLATLERKSMHQRINCQLQNVREREKVCVRERKSVCIFEREGERDRYKGCVRESA